MKSPDPLVELARDLAERALHEVVRHVLACPRDLRTFCVLSVAEALVDLSALDPCTLADDGSVARSIRESLRQQRKHLGGAGYGALRQSLPAEHRRDG